MQGSSMTTSQISLKVGVKVNLSEILRVLKKG